MKTTLTTKVTTKEKKTGKLPQPDALLNIALGAPQYSPFADGGLCARLHSKEKPITVLLAEHRILIRQGICALLAMEKGIRVIGEASDGCQAAELAERLHPDLVVFNSSLCLNPMVTLKRIRLAVPAPKIIILARHGEDALLQQAAAAGAAGCITEQMSAQMLIKTLQDISKGASVFASSYTRDLHAPPKSATNAPARKPLTGRQTQVLQLIAEGKSNKQTASDLSISIKTVEKHREKLMARLGIHETAGLTRYAISSGIVNGGF